MESEITSAELAIVCEESGRKKTRKTSKPNGAPQTFETAEDVAKAKRSA